MGLEIVEASYNVSESAYGSPVVLRGEIYDEVIISPVNVWMAEAYFPAFAAADVVIKHVRIAALEGKGDPLPHDPDAVDSVDERLCLRGQQIARSHPDER